MKSQDEDKFENEALNKQQKELATKLNFQAFNLYTPTTKDVIATIDVCYNNTLANVGIDITAYPNAPIIVKSYKTSVSGEYVPGYFSFYEGPVIIEALNYLNKENINPDLIIVDGHGLAHPRKFGLACYVDALSNKPTIGIAKRSLLPFTKDGLTQGQYAEKAVTINGENVGVAIRLQKNVNPVFVSPGNKISISTSIQVIKDLTGLYRLPDNLRRADAASRT